MKVFVCHAKVTYGGGMIVVAANSKEEAIGTMTSSGILSWCFLEDLYPKEEWKCIEGLTYDTDTPCVIDESHYRE